MINKKNKKKGFTSFELVALIASFVVLTILSFSMILKSKETATITKGYLILGEILDAQRMWFSVYRDFNPTEDWSVLGIETPNAKKEGFVYRFDSWLSGGWIQYRAEGSSWWIYGRITTDGYKNIWRELPEHAAKWKKCLILSLPIVLKRSRIEV